jgi:hypothetical protein
MRWVSLLVFFSATVGSVLPSLANDVQPVPLTAKPPARHRILVEGKWGFIDSAGSVVIEPKFGYAFDFSEGLAQIFDRGEVFYIDTSGKTAVKSPPSHDPRPFFGGFAIVQDAGGYSFLSRTGRVLERRFPLVENFAEGLAPVCVDEGKVGEANSIPKWGYLNEQGELSIAADFTAAGDFSHGLAPVYVGGQMCMCTGLNGGRWGYINPAGDFVIPPQFQSAASFSDGLARVAYENKRVGWITTKGEFQIEPRPFSIATSFKNGVARIRGTSGGEPGSKDFGYITKSGNVFTNPAFDAMSSELSDGLFEARAQPVWDEEKKSWRQGLYGYVDEKGEWVIEPQFSHTQPFRDGIASVQKDGQMKYVNKKGRTVWPK